VTIVLSGAVTPPEAFELLKSALAMHGHRISDLTWAISPRQLSTWAAQ